MLFSCQPPSEPAPPGPGVPLELARERTERISDLRYDLTFHLPAERSDSIPARLTVRFDLTEAGRPLALDFQADSSQVLGVTREGEPVAFTLANEHLLLPAAALTEGDNQFTVEFLAGDPSLNRSDDYLYTLLVPDRARTLFPCFDQPDLKARYRLTLTLPAEWEAVANGAAETTTQADGRKTVTYAETEPIPTYLFAFAAGRFRTLRQEVDGRPMTMYFRETDDEKVQANADTLFGLHAAALAWLEEYTGIPYPFEKFDFALLPGFQYGGMEHPGAIFYREPTLFLDESATENQQLRRAGLIAHETAHMWFGDLVTMQWFNDVWLKEVFANFMAAKIVNPGFPQINHELRFLLAHQPAAYSEDRSEGAHPIRQELDNLNHAGALYGRIIYQKAPVVMRQLEQRMGETALRAGLREYLNAFPYGNATWDDLIGILGGHTDQELAEWSRAWVKEASMPVITAEIETADGRLTTLRLRQEATSSGESYWPQYTEVALIYPDTVRRLPVSISGEVTEVPATGSLPVPAAVLPNGSEISYGYFQPDPASLEYFLSDLPSVADPLLRGAARMSLYEACLRDDLEPERFMEALLATLPGESDPLNREEMMGYIETLFWRFYRPQERQDLALRLEELIWGLLEQAPDVSTRAAYFRTYRSLALTDNAAQRLYRTWEGEVDLPYLPLSESDRIDLAAALALRLPDRAEAIIDAQLAQTTNPDRRQRFAFVRPALSPVQEVRDNFFTSLKKVENRHYEPWVVEAVGYLHHPLRAPDSEQYIYPSLELIQEVQATGDIFFPRQWITATLSGHQTAAAAGTVRRFLAERPDYPYRLRNKILMAADLLFRCSGKEEVE